MRRSVPKPARCRWLGRAALLLTLLPLTGCYYLQAARGQMAITRAQQPIDALLGDPAVDAARRDKLALAQAALDFAHAELALPDNGSYRRFVALDRDYVVVNVFAAPEFSLEPKTWCYPFAGCLAYRGYFDRADAERKAERLRAQGFDVLTSDVPAYSTLGRLKDPLLSTMLGGDDARLVSLLFHELAHQKLYRKDDTAFNEGFASAVAAIGMQRWRAARGETVSPVRERNTRVRERLFKLLEVLRDDLKVLYASGLDEPAMRDAKRTRFARLAADWRAAGATSQAPANNAALVPLAVYHDFSGAFLALYRRCGEALGCFYERAAMLEAQSDTALAEALRGLNSEALPMRD